MSARPVAHATQAKETHHLNARPLGNHIVEMADGRRFMANDAHGGAIGTILAKSSDATEHEFITFTVFHGEGHGGIALVMQLDTAAARATAQSLIRIADRMEADAATQAAAEIEKARRS